MVKHRRASEPEKRFRGEKSMRSLGTGDVQSFNDKPGQIGGALFCSNVVLQTKTPEGKHVFVGWHMYPPHVVVHSRDPKVLFLERYADKEGAEWLDTIQKSANDWETKPARRKRLKARFMKALKKEKLVKGRKALEMPPEAIIDVATEYLEGKKGVGEPIKATVIPGPVSLDGQKDTVYGSEFAARRVVNILKGHDSVQSVRQRGMSKKAATSGAGWVFLDNKDGRIHRANQRKKRDDQKEKTH